MYSELEQKNLLINWMKAETKIEEPAHNVFGLGKRCGLET